MALLKKLTLQSHDRTIIKDLSKVLEELKKRYGLGLTEVMRRNEDDIDHFMGLLDEIEFDCNAVTQRSIVVLRRKLLSAIDSGDAADTPSRSPSVHDERRNGDRLSAALKTVLYSDKLGLLCGRSLDVSMNGMRIEVERAIEGDTAIDLMFTLAHEDFEYLHKIRAMVASVKGNCAGVMFIGVEPETYTALERYLEQINE